MQQTDMLIVDGGIAGTATVCYFALSGYQVTLLEQSGLAVKASGLNAVTIWATGLCRTSDLSSMLSIGHSLRSQPWEAGEYATNLKVVASALS
jgi:2-polyprenyl-6-methoxyphenol hydroxylase-like FAD-dependent oxidoreductase